MWPSKSIAILLISLVVEISSECTLESSLIYQEVPEENYDSTYYDISAPGDPRPIGFTRNNTVYNEEDKNPCVSLDGVTDRHVQVMFEVIPNVPLCYKVNGEGKICEPSGRHKSCRTPTTTSKNLYEFFADSGEGASESDITFWYRLVRGPTSNEDPEDEWCMNRKNKFPADLLSLPPGFTNPPGQPQDPNSSTKVSSMSAILLLGLLVSQFTQI